MSAPVVKEVKRGKLRWSTYVHSPEVGQVVLIDYLESPEKHWHVLMALKNTCKENYWEYLGLQGTRAIEREIGVLLPESEEMFKELMNDYLSKL